MKLNSSSSFRQLSSDPRVPQREHGEEFRVLSGCQRGSERYGKVALALPKLGLRNDAVGDVVAGWDLHVGLVSCRGGEADFALQFRRGDDGAAGADFDGEKALLCHRPEAEVRASLVRAQHACRAHRVADMRVEAGTCPHFLAQRVFCFRAFHDFFSSAHQIRVRGVDAHVCRRPSRRRTSNSYLRLEAGKAYRLFWWRKALDLHMINISSCSPTPSHHAVHVGL
mmetsp:Transcript_13508/g.33168  ORF Transcript_13508/g.33168 Transcript_13508/m.33168 type:complete len:225 (+) Transcript_13508:913-1587(+)